MAIDKDLESRDTPPSHIEREAPTDYAAMYEKMVGEMPAQAKDFMRAMTKPVRKTAVDLDIKSGPAITASLQQLFVMQQTSGSVATETVIESVLLEQNVHFFNLWKQRNSGPETLQQAQAEASSWKERSTEAAAKTPDQAKSFAREMTEIFKDIAADIDIGNRKVIDAAMWQVFVMVQKPEFASDLIIKDALLRQNMIISQLRETERSGIVGPEEPKISKTE